MIKNFQLKYFLAFLTFLISFLTINFVINHGLDSDIPLHSLMLVDVLKKNIIPLPPLYYYSIYLFSGLKIDYQNFNYAAIGILSLIITFKYMVSCEAFYQFKIKKEQSINYHNLVYIILFFLMFIAPIIIDFSVPFEESKFYLGKIAINIWHNSTVIL